MRNFLKLNLSSEFRKDIHEKGAFCIEENGIVSSILLKKKKFYDYGNINDKGTMKWVYQLSISAFDKYSEFADTGIMNLIISASFDGCKIEPINNSNDAYHFDLDDKEGLKKSLNEIIVPWLKMFLDPSLVIQYLTELELLATGENNKGAIRKFGKLLINNDFPPRLLKAQNGIIATIYENKNDYKNALKYLKKHRIFVLNDHPSSCSDKSMNDRFNNKILLIDRGIKSLEKKI